MLRLSLWEIVEEEGNEKGHGDEGGKINQRRILIDLLVEKILRFTFQEL